MTLKCPSLLDFVLIIIKLFFKYQYTIIKCVGLVVAPQKHCQHATDITSMVVLKTNRLQCPTMGLKG